jgi:SAM-dependent methyltransferase
VSEVRATNYDSIAHSYDRRYSFQRYEGIAETLRGFVGSGRGAVLEVGCGTGHWLQLLDGLADRVAGMDLSSNMLARAAAAAPRAWLVRGRAEAAPWIDGAFDRIVCINALHHFTSREQFFIEARRMLRAGGGLLTVGLDPHAGRDSWWVYDYFPETIEIDRARFAPVRIIRGEMAKVGFMWTESMEAHHIESQRPLSEAFPHGVDRAFTSQLVVLRDDEFSRGVQRMSEAAQAGGGNLPLMADLRFYATTGWVG